MPYPSPNNSLSANSYHRKSRKMRISPLYHYLETLWALSELKSWFSTSKIKKAFLKTSIWYSRWQNRRISPSRTLKRFQLPHIHSMYLHTTIYLSANLSIGQSRWKSLSFATFYRKECTILHLARAKFRSNWSLCAKHITFPILQNHSCSNYRSLSRYST